MTYVPVGIKETKKKKTCALCTTLFSHKKSEDGWKKPKEKTSETADNRILMLVKRYPFMSLRQIAGKINNEVYSKTFAGRQATCKNSQKSPFSTPSFKECSYLSVQAILVQQGFFAKIFCCLLVYVIFFSIRLRLF